MKRLCCCLCAWWLAISAHAAPVQQLDLGDVTNVLARAVTRAMQISPNSVIAVVDREGWVLGVWSANGNTPSDEAVAAAISKAGTAAFLSSNQGALTSRTAGYIIQQHFPPGIKNTTPGPLVGVGLSSLPFSDINKFKGPGSTIVFSSTPGLAITPVPGTSLAGSPGGVPLYKVRQLVGGIGVSDGGPEIVPVAQTYDRDEDVALAGQTPFRPGGGILSSEIFINGIRLAYVSSGTSLNAKAIAPLGTFGSVVTNYPLIASPAPFSYPMIKLGGLTGELRQPIISDPVAGDISGVARLSASEVSNILASAVARARQTRSLLRLPVAQPTQMFITVVNNPGVPGVAPTVLGTFRTPDATLFSWDICVQKGRTVIYFSSDTRAYSARTVNFLAQSFYPPGIDGTAPGPYYGLQEQFSTLTNGLPPNPQLPNGMTIFPGAFPLYRNGVLIGAISVSGDGVDQDDLIAAAADVRFLAPAGIQAGQIIYRGARLPYAKFPRNPQL